MGETTVAADSRPASLSGVLERLRDMLPDLERRYCVRELAVFGSYVRGEETGASDLDVLVEFTRVPSLLTLIAMEHELSDALGVRVDLVLRRALRPGIGERVAHEAVLV